MVNKKRENEASKANYTPTLNTLMMVENTLKDVKDHLSAAELKKRLPKQVNHYTLRKILDYLEESRKIAVSMKGIKWIHDPLHRVSQSDSTKASELKKELQRGYIN